MIYDEHGAIHLRELLELERKRREKETAAAALAAARTTDDQSAYAKLVKDLTGGNV